MGFSIDGLQRRTRLRVFIDYNYPETIFGRLFEPTLGPIYAH